MKLLPTLLLVAAAGAAAADEPGSSSISSSSLRGNSNSVEGILPVWTYIEEGAAEYSLDHLCLQTNINYPVLLSTKIALQKDGKPVGVLDHGKTCAERGFDVKLKYDPIDDGPKPIKILYTGVSVWQRKSELLGKSRRVVSYSDPRYGCLETTSNRPALWMVDLSQRLVSFENGYEGKFNKGKTCKEIGYTVQTDQHVMGCKLNRVTAWLKPRYLGSTNMQVKLEDNTKMLGATEEVEGIIPVWTFADESACLQTNWNLVALNVVKQATAIDTGIPSGKIVRGKTCVELGYKKQGDNPFANLAPDKLFAGVTFWEPTPDDDDPKLGAVQVQGLIPVWTYAERYYGGFCLQTHTNYAALWLTMKGTSIDTGVPSGKIRQGKTCAELGFPQLSTDNPFAKLPALIKVVYTGVTTWVPSSTVNE